MYNFGDPELDLAGEEMEHGIRKPPLQSGLLYLAARGIYNVVESTAAQIREVDQGFRVRTNCANDFSDATPPYRLKNGLIINTDGVCPTSLDTPWGRIKFATQPTGSHKTAGSEILHASWLQWVRARHDIYVTALPGAPRPRENNHIWVNLPESFMVTRASIFEIPAVELYEPGEQLDEQQVRRYFLFLLDEHAKLIRPISENAEGKNQPWGQAIEHFQSPEDEHAEARRRRREKGKGTSEKQRVSAGVVIFG